MNSNSRSLSEWLDYISSLHPAAIELGLERVRSVYKGMQIAPAARQIVVVAGTNGKGSTVAMIEAALLALGFSVGSYTSPHIRRYNERVKINADPVSDESLVAAFERVERARADTPLTYFEHGTLAAFAILFAQPLDVLLLEIGLGGRLDAVNIIDADVSIITSVALDHTEWLGDTLAQIGAEKAGILRQGVVSILGADLPDSVFDRAAEIGSPQLISGLDFSCTPAGVFLTKYASGERRSVITYRELPNLLLPENNMLLALQTLTVLGERLLGAPANDDVDQLFDTRVFASIGQLKMPGRLEQVNQRPEIYLDVGHNPHAANYLKGFLTKQKLQGKIIRVVYSSLADKDVSTIASILAPVVDCWYLAPLDSVRALDRQSLERAVGADAKNMLSFASIPEALHQSIIASSEPTALILVFGSFYVIESAKAYFESNILKTVF